MHARSGHEQWRGASPNEAGVSSLVCLSTEPVRIHRNGVPVNLVKPPGASDFFSYRRRPACAFSAGGGGVSRGPAWHPGRLCRRRRVLRHFRFPDHRPDRGRASAGRSFVCGSPGAPREGTKNVRLIDPLPVFCDNRYCRGYDGDTVLYRRRPHQRRHAADHRALPGRFRLG